jgi:drug/metabolite transporter (DMT)-like permease
MTRAASQSSVTTVAFAALVVLVGTNLVAIRFTNRELAPLWNAGLRFGIAAALFTAIAIARGAKRPSRREVLGSVAYGLLGFAGFFAFVYTGLVHATAALGQTVLALGPLITLFLASAIGMEPLRWRAIAAAGLALVGIAIAFGAQEHLEVPPISLIALGAGATSFAAAGVIAKRLPPADPAWQNGIGTAVGAIVLLAISRLADETWQLPASTATWLWFVYLVVPGTLVIFQLFLYLLRRLPATVVSYQFVLAPLVSIVLGVALLDEPVGAGTVIGAGLVASAVYLGAFTNPS